MNPNIEAEQAVLSAILINPQSIKEVPWLSTRHFLTVKHQKIFEAMLELSEDGERIDFTTLKSKLEQRGLLVEVGGLDYLVAMQDGTQTSIGIRDHAELLRQTFLQNRIVHFAQSLLDKPDKIQYDSLVNRWKDFNKDIQADIESQDKVSNRVRNHILTDVTGIFNVTDIHRNLNLMTPNDKNNCSQTLRRLITEGEVERYGRKHGIYRKIDPDTAAINWLTDQGQPINLKLPLGLSKWTNIYSKGILVIAGSKDTGKTAWALNIAAANQQDIPTHYFTSELGPIEIKSRLKGFEPYLSVDDPAHWPMKVYERTQDFADVIRPDDLNIIDYMEITEDFSTIGKEITSIWKKLRHGVALIIIQKNPGSEWGRGGMFSAEKARLYITLDHDYPTHVARIVAAKNWKDPTKNPRNKQRQYKIVHGCQLFPTGEWEDYKPPKYPPKKY